MPSLLVHVLALLVIPFFSSTDRSTPCNIPGLILCVSHNPAQTRSGAHSGSFGTGARAGMARAVRQAPLGACSSPEAGCLKAAQAVASLLSPVGYKPSLCSLPHNASDLPLPYGFPRGARAWFSNTWGDTPRKKHGRLLQCQRMLLDIA